LKIYSVSFVLGILSFVFAYIVASRGYTSDEYVLEIFSGNTLIIGLVLIWSVVAFIAGLWAQAAGYEAVKRSVKGGALEFKDTFKSSRKYLLTFFITNLLVGLIVVGGFILLIIPGIIFAVWFSFSLWGVVDKGYGVGRSLKESKALVKGRFWKVLGRIFVYVVFVTLFQVLFAAFPQGYGSMAITIFGGLFLLPYYLLYRELGSE
ncbi:MAG: hypothetical protein UX13_C0012G0001, partial [Candidatus Woesebacteria bacterium GW2011_GWB1_45_5]